MSITSSLFRKAVKVLRPKDGRGNRVEKAEQFLAERGPRLEHLESREMMSIVTIATMSSAAEGGANGVIRVTRDDAMDDLTVRFQATGGSGLGPTREFTLNDGVNNLTTSVVIPNGATFVDINFVAVDDTLAEPTETITFKLLSGTGYTLSNDFSTRSSTATITDDEPIISVVATDTTSAESGTPATNTGTFTISRTGDMADPLTVSFRLTGTAGRNRDYVITDGLGTVVSSSAIIQAGSASVVLTITPIEDLRYEPTENVNITLRTSRNYTLDPDLVDRTASVIVQDNEPLIFVDPAAQTPSSFTIDTDNNLGADTYIQSGTSSDESHDAGPPFIQYVRDGTVFPGIPLEVRNAQGLIGFDSRKAYVSFDMSLFPFSNFSNAIFTLTLVEVEGQSPNNTNFRFNVFGLRDDFVPPANEQNENWNEDINYIDAPGNTADGGLVDVTDMFSGGPLGSFNIVGAGTIGQKVTISGQLLTDYLNAESTLDADADNLVTFVIVRENVGDPQLDTIIHKFGSRDDAFGLADPTVIPQLTGFGEVVGLEVEEDDFTTIRIFRAGNTVGDIIVPFTVRGAARLGIDYTLDIAGNPVVNSFTIPDGAAFVDLNVLTIDDGIYEIPESIEISLSNSPTYVLDGRNRVLRVQLNDNEPVVTLIADDDEAQEPDRGVTGLDTGFWTLTRTGDLSESLIVTVRYSGTALNGRDYELIDKQIAFLPGEASIVVVLDPNADTIPEGTETATMTLVPRSHYGLSWVLRGSRTSTGTELGPDIVSAANLSQARQLARNLGYAGPTLRPNEQSDTIAILNGNPPPGADLIAAYFTITLTNVDNDTDGGAFGTFVVRNQGNQAVGAFNILFVLTPDRTTGDIDDLELPVVTVQGLGAFSSTTVSVAFDDLSGLLPGSYIIIGIVDSDNFILETIEADNNGTPTDNVVITVTD